MIGEVNGIALLKELNDHNNAPLKFLCDDDDVYFLKYIIASEEEFDDLCYEVVCNRLAQHFGISTAEIAYVTPLEGSFDLDKLNKNRLFFRPGITAFGSKDIGSNDTLDNTGRFSIRKKTNFNRFLNPGDLIKAAIFDIHINNQDRFEENYNILVKLHEKLYEYYFIDHINVFGGPISRGKIRPTPINIEHKLIRSGYFRSLCRYYTLDELRAELEDYLYLCNNISEIIDEAFTTIPASWSYSHDLQTKIVTFLTDENRLENLRYQVDDHLQYLKSIKPK